MYLSIYLSIYIYIYMYRGQPGLARRPSPWAGLRSSVGFRCRANMSHIRQSRPGSGLDSQVEFLKTFHGVPSWIKRDSHSASVPNNRSTSSFKDKVERIAPVSHKTIWTPLHLHHQLPSTLLSRHHRLPRECNRLLFRHSRLLARHPRPPSRHPRIDIIYPSISRWYCAVDWGLFGLTWFFSSKLGCFIAWRKRHI